MKPSQLQLANETLQEYFGMSVPASILRKIAAEIPQLQEEIEMESTSDEFAREFLLEHVLAYFNVPKSEGVEAFKQVLQLAASEGKLELLDESKWVAAYSYSELEV